MHLCAKSVRRTDRKDVVQRFKPWYLQKDACVTTQSDSLYNDIVKKVQAANHWNGFYRCSPWTDSNCVCLLILIYCILCNIHLLLSVSTGSVHAQWMSPNSHTSLTGVYSCSHGWRVHCLILFTPHASELAIVNVDCAIYTSPGNIFPVINSPMGMLSIFLQFIVDSRGTPVCAQAVVILLNYIVTLNFTLHCTLMMVLMVRGTWSSAESLQHALANVLVSWDACCGPFIVHQWDFCLQKVHQWPWPQTCPPGTHNNLLIKVFDHAQSPFLVINLKRKSLNL